MLIALYVLKQHEHVHVTQMSHETTQGMHVLLLLYAEITINIIRSL